MSRLFSALVVIASFVISMGCTEDPSEDQASYVIEAFIFTGEPVEGIRISELTPLDSGSEAVAPVISDASVVLIKGNQSFQLDFDLTSGSYFYPGNDLIIDSGDELMLEVDVKGKTSLAQTLVPDPPDGVRKDLERIIVPHLAPTLALREQIIGLFNTARLKVEWDNPAGEFHYIVVENLEKELDPILPDVVPDDAKELLGSFRFITEPTVETVFEVVGVALETYGMHTVKVYRVNEEYADLFQNDTQDSRDLNAPPSNIVGAFGIFTSFASDSVVFEVVRE